MDLITLNFLGSIVGGALVCFVSLKVGYRQGMRRGTADGWSAGFAHGRKTMLDDIATRRRPPPGFRYERSDFDPSKKG